MGKVWADVDADADAALLGDFQTLQKRYGIRNKSQDTSIGVPFDLLTAK